MGQGTRGVDAGQASLREPSVEWGKPRRIAKCLSQSAFTGDQIVRNLPVMPKIRAAAGGDPATFCFRYRGGRRHHGLYDVLMTLNDAAASAISKCVTRCRQAPTFRRSRWGVSMLHV